MCHIIVDSSSCCKRTVSATLPIELRQILYQWFAFSVLFSSLYDVLIPYKPLVRMQEICMELLPSGE